MTQQTIWKIVAAAISLAIIAGVMVFLDRPSEEAPPGKQVWNFSVWGPPRAVTRGLEKTKEMLEAADSGFELKIHYGSALVPPKQALDSIKVGVIEGAMVCVGYHPAKAPLTSVLELPFLLTGDIETNAKIMDAVFHHPLIEAELARNWNTKYLTLLPLPLNELMGNRRIAGVADLDGVRIRTSGANSEALGRFGAVATNVTPPETYTALERGTLDMVGLPWTYALAAYRLQEVSQYATEGLSLSPFACFIAVSLDAWNGLPEEMQRLLPDLRDAGNRAMFEAYQEADRKWLPIFRKKLDVVPFPPAERAKLIAQAKPIWDQWVADMDAKGLAGTEMLAFVQAQVARHSP